MDNNVLSRNPKKDLLRINITALAERIGRTRTWTSQVLHGHEKSSTTRKLIAEALEMKVENLWPSGNNRNRAA